VCLGHGGLAGLTSISIGFTGPLPIELFTGIEHRQVQYFVSWVTFFDVEVDDEAIGLSSQVNLVTIVNITSSFDNYIGMWLEQTDQLLLGRYCLYASNRVTSSCLIASLSSVVD